MAATKSSRGKPPEQRSARKPPYPDVDGRGLKKNAAVDPLVRQGGQRIGEIDGLDGDVGTRELSGIEHAGGEASTAPGLRPLRVVGLQPADRRSAAASALLARRRQLGLEDSPNLGGRAVDRAMLFPTNLVVRR